MVEQLKMFVRDEDVLTDYGDGIIVVLAHNREEADEVLKKDSLYIYKETLGKEPAIYETPSVVSLHGSA
ncbi:MAG: hypothetical protein WCX79_01195 [Candidatus Paceibacterota bacterium]|jgi:hypothetical protein